VVTGVWIGALVGAATGALVFIALRRGCNAPAKIHDQSPESSVAVTETPVAAWDMGIYEFGGVDVKETEDQSGTVSETPVAEWGMGLYELGGADVNVMGDPVYDNRETNADEIDGSVYTEIGMP
jgi:hypothetical protein